jgi:MraZ protein
MFLGSYNVRLRDKNRISFPSKFRELTGDSLFITNWFENSLLILGKNDWEKFTTNIFKENSFLLPQVRDLERYIYGGTFEVRLDTEGRFVIPPFLKDHAKIGKNAVFVGGLWHISLWDEEVYNSYRDLNQIQIKDTAEKAYQKLIKS